MNANANARTQYSRKPQERKMDTATEAPASEAEVQPRAIKPLAVQLKEKQANFTAALPAHIPAERFMRVVLTATQNDPALAKADRPSLFNACMRAAQDGLLPDGRDGALVIYNTKVKNPDTGSWDWVAKVQWMPMIGGIRKKVRNSATISTWDVHTVHAKDDFAFELGDDPYIKHKPYMPGSLAHIEGEKPEAYTARLREHCDRGPMIAVYSVAVLKTGEKSRDVMSRFDVDQVRDTYSKRNRDGEFSPAWVKSYDEMAKKTVARRHAKVLPMSSDLDDLLRRDDALYDLDGASDKQRPRIGSPKSTADRIDAMLSAAAKSGEEVPEGENDAGLTIDNDTGEILSQGMDEEPATNNEPASAAPAADAVGAEPNAPPRPGSAPTSSAAPAADPNAELVADLTATGQARAESGMAALRNFLDDLEPGERRLIPQKTVEGWLKVAKAAKPSGA